LEEARAEIKRSLELDPLWVFTRSLEPYALMYRDKSQAVQRARDVIELFPWYWLSYLVAAMVLGMSGLPDEALSVLKRGLATDPENVFLLAALALNHGLREERKEAIRIQQQLEVTAKTRYISPCALAIASIGCGDVERTGVSRWYAISMAGSDKNATQSHWTRGVVRIQKPAGQSYPA
jgi:hypothetical protein